MNIKSLRAFVTILDQRSFQDAAAILNTVQSNMTAHVRKLETELGCKLIERAGTIRATPDGTRLERRAREILRLHDLAVADLRYQGKVAGTLRIGAMETTAARRLPPVLLQLGRECPDLRLSLTVGSTGILKDMMLRREIDCAFVARPMEGVFASEPVFEETLQLVRPTASADPLHADDLEAYPLLAFRTGCTYREQAERMFEHAGITPVIHEFGSLDAIAGCLRAGMGQAVLPKSYFESSGASKTLHSYELPRNLAECPTYLVRLAQGENRLVDMLAHLVHGASGIAAGKDTIRNHL
ncbi:LysR family transcriptional regulator [Falsirhodobacter halotolerans]|uniref:LysR family transcriptional regulator n=1 Tax=Falsirhodobacter halotolerans TaxID=1146892 RepID=UPI001FD5A097|nr:LysR family transcriptional regulator [Falsirhodobacter halotolerans]MCJ8140111.1 LysR family transcriptional regulator [Falsirhodobacter halotolerans]